MQEVADENKRLEHQNKTGPRHMLALAKPLESIAFTTREFAKHSRVAHFTVNLGEVTKGSKERHSSSKTKARFEGTNTKDMRAKPFAHSKARLIIRLEREKDPEFHCFEVRSCMGGMVAYGCVVWRMVPR